MNIFIIFEGFFNLIRYKLSRSYRLRQKELFEKRLKICEGCKYVNLKLRQCKECGCIIDAKTKVIYKLDKDGYSIYYIDPITKEIYYSCPKKYW